MSQKQLFIKDDEKPFKLSRSKLESFINCPRCFYLDRKLGITIPPSAPYTINSSIDFLFKKEFDAFRIKGQMHPMMIQAKLNMVPFNHPLLDTWRNYKAGLQRHVKDVNITVYGAVDDIWAAFDGTLAIVDYKSTGANKIDMDDKWKDAYKRQMEVYQWLLRGNGFKVSDTAYFVYTKVNKDVDNFNNKLAFETSLIPYKGNDNWVGDKVHDVYNCLCSNDVPPLTEECPHCKYISGYMNTIRGNSYENIRK